MLDVSLKGLAVEQDKDDMKSSYGEGVKAADLLSGAVAAPRETLLLYKQLQDTLKSYGLEAAQEPAAQ